MYSIENDQLKIGIAAKGAELQHIYFKDAQLEYLWNGNPEFWAKKSPVLFPIVGTLKHDRYYFEDRAYHMTRHGFARDMEFTVVDQKENAISFSLTSNEDS